MFSGLITAVGVIRAATRTSTGLELRIAAPFRGLKRGESVAIDGACLTVTRLGRGTFTVQVIDTTLDRTRFGNSVPGDGVNLERALRAGDRLGGHLVLGHVDGLGTVRSVTRRRDAVVVELQVPRDVARISVPLGSITVDGVSLTIVALPGRSTVRLSLIPFTLQHTTLGRLRRGSVVHVEGDVLGKYINALATGYGRQAKRPRRP
jgi:riboflavin synthase alpha subunit